VVAISPSSSQCNNTCQEIEMAPYCLFPADQDHGQAGQPDQHTGGSGGTNNGGGNPHSPRLLKMSPLPLDTPTLKSAKKQNPHFDATQRPHSPIL
jgi:hypothetical protein